MNGGGRSCLGVPERQDDTIQFNSLCQTNGSLKLFVLKSLLFITRGIARHRDTMLE